MSETQIENGKSRVDDIDSKIADFMADIDEIVLGRKLTEKADDKSDWQQCFDETSQSVYYWNRKTNRCSWEIPSSVNENSNDSNNIDDETKKKRQQIEIDSRSPKKLKSQSLFAEYESSEGETDDDEENVDDIDELLNEVLDKEDKKPQSIDLYPLFEADCRAAIARLSDLGDKSPEIYTLRIQLETRLEDCLSGHLAKRYAVQKLEQSLPKIEELETIHLTTSLPPDPKEQIKASISSSEMALLLSLPPPPPPPSPPPLPENENQSDTTLQLFYSEINCDQLETSTSSNNNGKILNSKKNDQHQYHKDKKSKPAKTLPTNLIQKWTNARHELLGINETDDP